MKTVKMGKKTLAIAVLMAVLCIGLAYGAVVNYLSNTATVTTTVKSPIVVKGDIKRLPNQAAIDACVGAADRLVALQGTDGGWDWIVTGLETYSGESGSNLYGVTAFGLIDAYELTHDSRYYDAAKKVADMMIAYGENYEGFKDAGLGQSWDLRFLVNFAYVSGDSTYSNWAKDYWDWVKTREAPNVYADGKQEEFYGFYTAIVSPGYAIWDCADFGLAALAVGNTDWARAMAIVVNAHLPDITDTDDYRFIGWGHALDFLNAVDSTTYTDQIGNLKTTLTGSQEADGRWESPNGNVQDTAYVIMGLNAIGETDTAKKGAAWLVAKQGYDAIDGGWKDQNGVEYSQVDSEALQAIADVIMPIEPTHTVSFDTEVSSSVVLEEIFGGDTIIAIGTEENLANNPVTAVVAVVIPAPAQWSELELGGWTGEEMELFWRYPGETEWTLMGFDYGWKTAGAGEYAVILVGGYFADGKVVAGAGSTIPPGGSMTVEVRTDFAQNVAPGSYTLHIVAVNPGTPLESIPAAAGLP